MVAMIPWMPKERVQSLPASGLDSEVAETGLISLAKTFTAMMQFLEMFDTAGEDANIALGKTLADMQTGDLGIQEKYQAVRNSFLFWAERILDKDLQVSNFNLCLGPVTNTMLQTFLDTVHMSPKLTLAVVQEASIWTANYHDFRRCAETWEADRDESLNATDDWLRTKELLSLSARMGMRPLGANYMFDTLTTMMSSKGSSSISLGGTQ